MNTIKCWHCGAENPTTNKYCDSCGRDLWEKTQVTNNPSVQPPPLPPVITPNPPISKSYKIAAIVLTIIIIVEVVILLILLNNKSSGSALQPIGKEIVYVQDTQLEETVHKEERSFSLCCKMDYMAQV